MVSRKTFFSAGIGPYLLITCTVCWLLAGALFLSGHRASSALFSAAAMLYMLVPAAVAIVLQKRLHREDVKNTLHVSFSPNRWWMVAALTPAVLVALSFGLSLLVPGVTSSVTGEGMIQRYAGNLTPEQADLVLQQLQAYSPFTLMSLIVLSAFVAGCTINAVFAFGEELGWRGYLLHRFEGQRLLPVSLLIGFIWGVWHFPLILMGHNYPNHPVAGVFMMIVFCMLLSPMMTYITLKARSVIAPAVFHGTMNALAGLPLIYLTGGSDLNIGLTGYTGFAAIAAVTLVFFIFDRYVTREKLFTRPLHDTQKTA